MSQMSERRGSPSICLLGVTYATNNLGVNALTDSAISGILRHFPNAHISLLDYAKDEARCEHILSNGRRVPVKVVPVRFSKNVTLRNNVALLLLASFIGRLIPTKMRHSLHSRFPVLEHLEQCDMVAAASGGDSFSDIYGAFRFFYVSLPQILIAVMGKPLILLPQTVGPFRTNLARWTARIILLSAKRVYARDYISLRRARDLVGFAGNRSKVQFRPDMAFTLPVSTDSPEMKDFVGESTKGGTIKPIAVNVSGLLYMGGYSRANMFGLRVDYQRLVREIVHLLLNLHPGPVVLLPHVFGAKNLESDEAVCTTLHEEFGHGPWGSRVLLPKFHYDQREVKSLIANCEFVVASRMHVCIAALSQGVPAVGVAYSPKFQGVMESMNLIGLIADPRSQDEGQVLDQIRRTYVARNTYREMLEKRISKIRLKAEGLFTDFESYLTDTWRIGMEPDAPRIILRGDYQPQVSGVNGYGDKSRVQVSGKNR